MRGSKYFDSTKMNVKLFESPAKYYVGDDPFDLDRDTMISLTLVYLFLMGNSKYLRKDVVQDIFVDSDRAAFFNRNVVGELREKFVHLHPFIDLEDRKRLGIRWDAGISVDVHEFRYLIAFWYRNYYEAGLYTGVEYLIEALSLFVQPFYAGATPELQEGNQDYPKHWGSFYKNIPGYKAFTAWRKDWDARLKQEARWATEQLVRCHCLNGNLLEALEETKKWIGWDSQNEAAYYHLLRLNYWVGDMQGFQQAMRFYNQKFSQPVYANQINEINRHMVRSQAPHRADFSPGNFCLIKLPKGFEDDFASLPADYKRRFISSRMDSTVIVASPSIPVQPSVAGATIYYSIDSLPSGWIKRTLYGREEAIDEVFLLLEPGKSVVIYGLPGIGKTALARKLVVNFIHSDPANSVLWLDVGQANTHEVLEVIAEACGIKDKFDQEQNKNHVVRRAIMQKSIRLAVVDDVWSSETYSQLIDVLPASVAILVTTRLNFTMSDDELVRYKPLMGLDEEYALECLSKVSQRQFSWANPDVIELVRVLDGHPLSIRIAGGMLRRYEDRPTREPHEMVLELHENLTGLHDPNLKLPSFNALMNVSINFLSEEARTVFSYLGVLCTSQFTANLIAGLVSGDIQNTASVEAVLEEIRRNNLIEQVGTISAGDRNVPFYALHDHVREYARTTFPPSEDQRKVFLGLIKPVVENEEVLRKELGNVLGFFAASERYSSQESLQLKSLRLSTLLEMMVATIPFFFVYGHTEDSLHLLNQSIMIAEERKESAVALALYKARGNVYLLRRNKPDNAIADFQRALNHSKSICERARMNYGMAVAHIERKDAENSLNAIRRAEKILATVPEDQCRVEREKVLEAWGRYFLYVLEKPKQAVPWFKKLFDMTLDDDDMKYTGALDSGHVMNEIGSFDKAQFYYEQALSLASKFNNDHKRAYAYQGLGEVAHRRGDAKIAQDNFDLAFQLLYETNDSEQLTKLVTMLWLDWQASLYCPFPDVRKVLEWLELSNKFPQARLIARHALKIYTDGDYEKDKKSLLHYIKIVQYIDSDED